ncbi:MAG: SUMF1/EgtB/PvdO family nonheme iron enzyme, partial [bacterium]
GVPLSELEKQQQLLSALEILDVMEGLGKAMDHLHTNDLVHCDIKPANILRLHNGTVKLIDYGLAFSIVAELKQRPSKVGTKGFMSPEQQSGRPIFDHRSDIYSAGCVLNYMLGKLIAAQVPSETKLASQLKTIADRMVMESPGRRYQSAGELLPELHRARQAHEEAINSKDRKRATVKAFMTVLALSLPVLAWQAWLSLDTRATLTVKNHEPGDVLNLTADDGMTKSLELAGSSSFSVPPGNYRLSLSVPDNRTLTPGNLVVSDRDQVTVTINGDRKPLSIKMVGIPAGKFLMGASEDDKPAEPNEFPRRVIEFKNPFLMSAYEVTVSQFREFVVATGYVTYAERSGEGGWTAKKGSSWGNKDKDYKWSNPGYVISDTFPVSMVTYDDATAFCKWLSQREKKTYRLPTEAEWEYACRATTTTSLPFDPKSRDSYAWTQYNARTTPNPRPVGTRQPNAWGLYDMVGNVREWCL